MSCNQPLQAWKSDKQNPASGKSYIIFKPPRKARDFTYLSVNCGRCLGCRLDRSRQWAIRCTNEIQMHPENTFITLTFDEEHLHPKQTLTKEHFQKFMKRLRKLHEPKIIRFMHVGEYGERNGRPHHHAILFNHEFKDKIETRNYTLKGKQIKAYESKELSKLWPFGKHEIGEANFQTAAYIARYCCKNKDNKQPLKLPRLSSRIDGKKKEFNTMSMRPGIGSTWLKKFGETDVWNHDHIVLNGIKMLPPTYYTNQYDLTNPQECANLKEERLKVALKSTDNTWDRLQVKLKVKESKMKQLTRSIK